METEMDSDMKVAVHSNHTNICSYVTSYSAIGYRLKWFCLSVVHLEISEISVYTKNNIIPGKQSTSIQKWHPRRTQVKDVNT